MEAAGQYKSVIMHSAATATGNGTTVECTEVSGGAYKFLAIHLDGISGDTITWEATIDGTHWEAMDVVPLAATDTPATTATADGLYRADVTGLSQFRARISTYGAGTITATAVLTAV